jgi:predicted Rossmann fold nucleotide-binding protein DprA/Smf involved in DNA uptake
VLLKNLRDKSVFEKATQELEFIKSNEINAVYFQDEDYPERLKQCIDGPLLLFTSGNINLKKQTNHQHCRNAPNYLVWNGILPKTDRRFSTA